MTWEVMVVCVTLIVCASAIGAWVLWLVHDDEPIDPDDEGD